MKITFSRHGGKCKVCNEVYGVMVPVFHSFFGWQHYRCAMTITRVDPLYTRRCYTGAIESIQSDLGDIAVQEAFDQHKLRLIPPPLEPVPVAPMVASGAAPAGVLGRRSSQEVVLTVGGTSVTLTVDAIVPEPSQVSSFPVTISMLTPEQRDLIHSKRRKAHAKRLERQDGTQNEAAAAVVDLPAVEQPCYPRCQIRDLHGRLTWIGDEVSLSNLILILIFNSLILIPIPYSEHSHAIPVMKAIGIFTWGDRKSLTLSGITCTQIEEGQPYLPSWSRIPQAWGNMLPVPANTTVLEIEALPTPIFNSIVDVRCLVLSHYRLGFGFVSIHALFDTPNSFLFSGVTVMEFHCSDGWTYRMVLQTTIPLSKLAMESCCG